MLHDAHNVFPPNRFAQTERGDKTDKQTHGYIHTQLPFNCTTQPEPLLDRPHPHAFEPSAAAPLEPPGRATLNRTRRLLDQALRVAPEGAPAAVPGAASARREGHGAAVDLARVAIVVDDIVLWGERGKSVCLGTDTHTVWACFCIYR